nr:hypothetical protein Iba_chr14bCG15710 [Ipomoea batatas]
MSSTQQSHLTLSRRNGQQRQSTNNGELRSASPISRRHQRSLSPIPVSRFHGGRSRDVNSRERSPTSSATIDRVAAGLLPGILPCTQQRPSLRTSSRSNRQQWRCSPLCSLQRRQAVRNDGGFYGLSLLPPATNSDEVFSSKLRPSPSLGTDDGKSRASVSPSCFLRRRAINRGGMATGFLFPFRRSSLVQSQTEAVGESVETIEGVWEGGDGRSAPKAAEGTEGKVVSGVAGEAGGEILSSPQGVVGVSLPSPHLKGWGEGLQRYPPLRGHRGPTSFGGAFPAEPVRLSEESAVTEDQRYLSSSS